MDWYYRDNAEVKMTVKKVAKNELNALVRELRTIRNRATMTNANFSDEIKDETEEWRRAWIIAPLDRLIARYSEDI